VAQTVLFSVREVEKLRREAGPHLPRLKPDFRSTGWAALRADPGRILAAFPCLRLKRGFVLRAYLYREAIGGNAVIWAVPRGTRLPPPETCPLVAREGLPSQAPKPPGALDDFMEAIEGEGSPWSYLCASVLARELEEFGAWWHGLDWSTHLLVGRVPDLQAAPQPEQWQWVAEPPAHWPPSVVLAEDSVTVRLHTYSEAYRKAFYEHRDTYPRGSYCFRREKIVLIEGPPGFCF
jgi:hypothetical protein